MYTLPSCIFPQLVVYYHQEVSRMKAIKRIVKRIFCKHDYWLYGIFTMGARDHEYKDMMCRCSKCGKEKSYKFKKPLDNFIEL